MCFPYFTLYVHLQFLSLLFPAFTQPLIIYLFFLFEFYLFIYLLYSRYLLVINFIHISPSSYISFLFIWILFIYFLYSRYLLVINFIHISVYMSIPISQFIPPPHPPPPLLSPLGVHMYVLYICVYFCLANWFFCTIFLDSTYMH